MGGLRVFRVKFPALSYYLVYLKRDQGFQDLLNVSEDNFSMERSGINFIIPEQLSLRIDLGAKLTIWYP
jgi:hypothetical protein